MIAPPPPPVPAETEYRGYRGLIQEHTPPSCDYVEFLLVDQNRISSQCHLINYCVITLNSPAMLPMSKLKGGKHT